MWTSTLDPLVSRDPHPTPPTALDAPTGEHAALVARARLGDAAAFTRLVALLQRRVFRWALAFAADADEADDITQDAFIVMHRRLADYRGDAPIEAWLYRIVRRSAEDRRRTRARRRRLREATSANGESNVYHTDPGGRVDRERAAALILTYFAALPPRQREVFDLVDLQGYDPADAAQMTGLKPVTLRANLFKARRTVRTRLLAMHPHAFDADR